MPRRVIGTVGTRPITGGRAVETGNRLGRSPKTRPVAQPRVTPIYDHCRAKNKAGSPCGAHNVKGEPYCQGHLNAMRIPSEPERTA